MHALTGLVAALLMGCAVTGDSAPNAAASDPDPIAIRHDVPYATRAGETLQADVYRPRFGRHPGVVLVHPGGWFSGHRRDVASIAVRLAEAGYVAVAPSYRLAPRHRFPAQIHDLKEAVRWMRANADELGLDPDRIGAFGFSSGGHLAALLATSDPADGLEGDTAFPDTSSRVQALVAGGAPSDLSAMPPNPAVSRLLGGSASDHPDLAATASPVRFVTADDPPAFLYHGRFDPFIFAGQSRSLLRAFQREGVPARLDLGLLGHFTTWLFGRRQEAAAVAFLDAWIGGASPTRVASDAPSEPPS